jgi:hypothetical protein
MRRNLYSLGIATAACCVGLLATAHGRSQPSSQLGRFRLVSVDLQAQVYARRHEGDISFSGCSFGRHRSYLLGRQGEGTSSGTNGVSHFVLAGPLVAFERFSIIPEVIPPGLSEWFVEVVDLRNGHTVHRVPTGAPVTPSSTYSGVGPVVSLVLKADGAVAWIAQDFERSKGAPYYDVEAADRGGGGRLLAAGANIDPNSLALAGKTLYWTESGRPFSARAPF